MQKLLDRPYRQLMTGFAFACFFLGGGLMACSVFPLLVFHPRQHERVQDIIHHSFRAYLAALRFLGLLELDIRGRERLEACRGRLIIANHPSLLDVVILMALVRNTQCIVKHQLWRSPFLGGVMRAAGYIRNDLEGASMIEACRHSLQSGANIIIFPEGTRSRGRAVFRFHRGFANIAILNEADLQPVIISCAPPTLKKGDRWWAVPPTRPRFTVSVVEPVLSGTYVAGRNRGIASRKLVARMEAYYADYLGNV